MCEDRRDEGVRGRVALHCHYELSSTSDHVIWNRQSSLLAIIILLLHHLVGVCRRHVTWPYLCPRWPSPSSTFILVDLHPRRCWRSGPRRLCTKEYTTRTAVYSASLFRDLDELDKFVQAEQPELYIYVAVFIDTQALKLVNALYKRSVIIH